MENLVVSSADILRLIQAHLTEAGLHESARALRQESGVGQAGVSHNNFRFWAEAGQWPLVLQSLAVVDRDRAHINKDLLAEVHEMATLELAENNDIELAYSVYRLTQSDLEQVPSKVKIAGQEASRARILEQKLASLVSKRQKDQNCPVPDDFYDGLPKQQRRTEIGKMLSQAIPQQPTSRLLNLLQDALSWQTYTGQIPRVKQWWDDEEPVIKDRKRRKTKHFDIVLGTVDGDKQPKNRGQESDVDGLLVEPIPKDPYTTVKFGKHATAEAALFLNDGSLVIGSSDGLVEVWDASQKYKELRLDLPYQQREELLGHDASIAAMAATHDSTILATASRNEIKVWRLDTGKLLRKIDMAATVNCLSFAPDGSHLLVGLRDGVAREYGLRASRMLKEFTGHGSYVNTCFYHLMEDALYVVTASADGSVRLFDASTSDCLRVIRPVSLGKHLSTKGASVIAHGEAEISTDSPSIHTVVPLHSPPNTWIIVPRGSRAFMINTSGVILQVYDTVNREGQFVAATVSPSNRWLYVVEDDGTCSVFQVADGTHVAMIRDFSRDTTSKMSDEKNSAEITALLHHPSKVIIGGFSNNKAQKKGVLTLWK